MSAAEALLTRMLDPAWWREEVDSGGEYTTTRARGYYEVVPEIRDALAMSPACCVCGETLAEVDCPVTGLCPTHGIRSAAACPPQQPEEK